MFACCPSFTAAARIDHRFDQKPGFQQARRAFAIAPASRRGCQESLRLAPCDFVNNDEIRPPARACSHCLRRPSRTALIPSLPGCASCCAALAVDVWRAGRLRARQWKAAMASDPASRWASVVILPDGRLAGAGFVQLEVQQGRWTSGGKAHHAEDLAKVIARADGFPDLYRRLQPAVTQDARTSLDHDHPGVQPPGLGCVRACRRCHGNHLPRFHGNHRRALGAVEVDAAVDMLPAVRPECAWMRRQRHAGRAVRQRVERVCG